MKFYSKKLKKFFAMICAFCLIVEFSLSGIQVKAAEPTPKVTYTVTGETTVGKQITINLNVSNINGLYGGSWDFAYDPNVIRIDEITSGELISSIPQTTTSNKSGHAYFWFSKTGDTTGVSTTEAKSIAKIKATVLKEGTVNIDTTDNNNLFGVSNKSSLVKLSDKNGDKISYISEDKSISCIKPIVVLQAGKYDNTHPSLLYSDGWITPSDKTQTFSNINNSKLSFSFNGTGFNLHSISANNRGIAKIIIDGQSYTADGYSANGVKKIIFSKIDLPKGKHTVDIIVTNSKNFSSLGYFTSIDAIEILDYSNTLTPGKYDNTHPSLLYSDGWITPSDKTQTFSNINNSKLSFSFNGTGFNLHSISANNRGIAKIIIDGQSYTADGYSANGVKKIIFSKIDLPKGKHTVDIIVTNSKNSSSLGYFTSIDAIEIF